MRRDHINHEINKLRDLPPIPASARQRLSQLQLMALILVYVRKTNYFEKREYRDNCDCCLSLPRHRQSDSFNILGSSISIFSNFILTFSFFSISSNRQEQIGKRMIGLQAIENDSNGQLARITRSLFSNFELI